MSAAINPNPNPSALQRILDRQGTSGEGGGIIDCFSFVSKYLSVEERAAAAVANKHLKKPMFRHFQTELSALCRSDEIPEYLKKTMTLYRGKLAPINCIYLAWNKLVERKKALVNELRKGLNVHPHNPLYSNLYTQLDDVSGYYEISKFIKLSKTIKGANSILFLHKYAPQFVSSRISEIVEYDAETWGRLLNDYINQLEDGFIPEHNNRNILTETRALLYEHCFFVDLPEELNRLPNLQEVHWSCPLSSSLEGSTFPPNLTYLNLRGSNISSIEDARLPETLKALNLSSTKIVSLSRANFEAGLKVIYNVPRNNSKPTLRQIVLSGSLKEFITINSKVPTTTKIKEIALFILASTAVTFLSTCTWVLLTSRLVRGCRQLVQICKSTPYIFQSPEVIKGLTIYAKISIVISAVLLIYRLVMRTAPHRSLKDHLKDCISIGTSFTPAVVLISMIAYSAFTVVTLIWYIHLFLGSYQLLHDLLAKEKALPKNIPYLKAD